MHLVIEVVGHTHHLDHLASSTAEVAERASSAAVHRSVAVAVADLGRDAWVVESIGPAW